MKLFPVIPFVFLMIWKPFSYVAFLKLDLHKFIRRPKIVFNHVAAHKKYASRYNHKSLT